MGGSGPTQLVLCLCTGFVECLSAPAGPDGQANKFYATLPARDEFIRNEGEEVCIRKSHRMNWDAVIEISHTLKLCLAIRNEILLTATVAFEAITIHATFFFYTLVVMCVKIGNVRGVAVLLYLLKGRFLENTGKNHLINKSSCTSDRLQARVQSLKSVLNKAQVCKQLPWIGEERGDSFAGMLAKWVNFKQRERALQ